MGGSQCLAMDETVKSMASLENVAKFLVHCVNEQRNTGYNYVDKPDLSMNELSSRKKNDFFISRAWDLGCKALLVS